MLMLTDHDQMVSITDVTNKSSSIFSVLSLSLLSKNSLQILHQNIQVFLLLPGGGESCSSEQLMSLVLQTPAGLLPETKNRAAVPGCLVTCYMLSGCLHHLSLLSTPE